MALHRLLPGATGQGDVSRHTTSIIDPKDLPHIRPRYDSKTTQILTGHHRHGVATLCQHFRYVNYTKQHVTPYLKK